jgi:hypothetical protein
MTSMDTSSQNPQELEYIDSKELAKRLNLPDSWVRNHTQASAKDPIPHADFDRYVRYLWNGPELTAWLKRRMK